MVTISGGLFLFRYFLVKPYKYFFSKSNFDIIEVTYEVSYNNDWTDNLYLAYLISSSYFSIIINKKEAVRLRGPKQTQPSGPCLFLQSFLTFGMITHLREIGLVRGDVSSGYIHSI